MTTAPLRRELPLFFEDKVATTRKNESPVTGDGEIAFV
jgi:hypothetical protein